MDSKPVDDADEFLMSTGREKTDLYEDCSRKLYILHLRELSVYDWKVKCEEVVVGGHSRRTLPIYVVATTTTPTRLVGAGEHCFGIDTGELNYCSVEVVVSTIDSWRRCTVFRQ